jgi:molybdopterin/thiamine biosynthesis adenylyltransferase
MVALRQLAELAEIEPSFKVGAQLEHNGIVFVDVSLDTAVIPRGPGLKLRAREEFVVLVRPSFPYSPPTIRTKHRRWRGTAHVHWGETLCLYAAPTVEWNPSDGMFGLVDRLWEWLTSAAAGELDPADAPLHPPVTYGIDYSMPAIVVRADAPVAAGEIFVGLAELDRPAETHGRADVVGYRAFTELSSAGWPEHFGLCLIMPGAFDWEYPETVAELFAVLAARGIGSDLMTDLLTSVAVRLPEGRPLVVIIGTPMRRIEGATLIHLVAFAVDSETAGPLRRRLLRDVDEDGLRRLGEAATAVISDWIRSAKISWCRLLEDRPQIVRRREQGSPIEAFRGKRVVVWGCGAIGAHVTEAIARAGAAKLTLYDNQIVTPGILVRQPFRDSEIGQAKSECLARRLRVALPRLDVTARIENVLTGPLARSDWGDGAEIVIDATASVPVAAKLERVRRRASQPAWLISIVFGHEASRGMVTVTPPEHTAGPCDLARKAKIHVRTKAAPRRQPNGYGSFASEFWPDEQRPRSFQPEPGCSAPTFRGSFEQLEDVVDVVGVGVAEQEVVDLLGLAFLLAERCDQVRGALALAPGVVDDVELAGVEQDCLALADIDEGHSRRLRFHTGFTRGVGRAPRAVGSDDTRRLTG